MTVIRRQGIKNTVYTYLGIILGMLSTLYIQPFFLSKEQIGITRLVISAGTILASFSCIGITAVIVKYFPIFYNKEKKHNYFFTLALSFPIIGFVLCFAIVSFFESAILKFYGNNAAIFSEYFWPIMLLAFFNCMIFAFTAYCNSINKSSISTFVNEVLNRAGFIICILLFSYGITMQNTFVYSLSLIYFTQLVILFLIIKHYDHPSFNFSFFTNNTHLKKIIGFSLISAFIQITAICIKNVDVIFVGKYRSLDQVGVYAIAAFIGLVIETPLGALDKIAAPKISKLFADQNHVEIAKIYKLSSKYLMIFCGLLSCVLVVCIQPVLSLLPNDYSSGYMVTIIICIGAFINSATGVNQSIITYSNFYKLGAVFYFLLLVCIIILNVVLIPVYGIMGAAIASALISVIHNLIRFILIKVKFKMQPFSWDSLKIVAIISASVLAAWFIETENKFLLIFLRGMASSGVFVISLVITNVFSIKELKKEIRSFKNTFI